MREFHGEAARATAAQPADCLAPLAAVDRYPSWCPDAVQAVEVLDRGADGRPSRVRMRIHVAFRTIVRDFDLFLTVAVDPPTTVRLTRVTDHPTEQEFHATWTVGRSDGTRIALELDARLRVPRQVPAGGVADTIAEALVSAACRALVAPVG